jgi:SanA protein
MKPIIRFFRWVVYSLLLVLTFIIFTNVWVIRSTAPRIYEDVNDLPADRMGLVLGTSHKLMDGSPNPFFEQRITAAAELYNLQKIRHIIVSGDNRTKYYNEPHEMQKALIIKGVPRKAITLDYAGLRTLDSVVRSKEIFEQDQITIITQPFHAYRALFISESYGLDAVAYLIEEPAITFSIRVRLREYIARTLAVMDLYILKTGPKHLGEKEPIS